MPSKSPIHSKKHYVQVTLSSVTNGAIANEELINAIEGAATAPKHVHEGAVVKAVYLEFWLAQASASVGSFTAFVYKLPGPGVVAATADGAALHDWDNKKNILYCTQGLSPANDAMGQMNIIRSWIMIPKGKQRFGLNDRLYIAIRNNNGADDINYCGFATYKSYD